MKLSFIIARALPIGWSNQISSSGAPEDIYCFKKEFPNYMESHAGLAAKDSDSEGTDLRRPEVDVP